MNLCYGLPESNRDRRLAKEWGRLGKVGNTEQTWDVLLKEIAQNFRFEKVEVRSMMQYRRISSQRPTLERLAFDVHGTGHMEYEDMDRLMVFQGANWARD